MVAEREEILLTVRGMLSNVKEVFSRANSGIKSLKQNVSGFNQVMGMNMETWKGSREGLQNFGNAGQKGADTIRNFTHGMRGFRMEMLGVMFFGMMLSRTFTNLLKPTMELFGIFELWRVTLQVFFLPIVEMLFPWFLKLTEWLMNLSPEIQTLIGLFVLAGIVFGATLFIIGSFALGIGSLIQLIGGAGLGAVLPIVGAALVIFAGIFVVLFGVVELASGKLEGLGIIITGIGIALIPLIGWWALIPIALGAAVFLIIKHWDDIKRATANAINSMIDKIDWFLKKLGFAGIQWRATFGDRPLTGTIPASEATAEMFTGDPFARYREAGRQSINIVQNNEYSGIMDIAEVERINQEAIDKMVEDIKRQAKLPGYG